MINLVENEIYKIVRRKKIYIFSFILLLLIIISSISTNIIDKSGIGILFTGQSFPVTLLDSLVTTAIPIMLIVIISDMITGEFNDGSIKLILTRAVSRKEIIFGKLMALALVIFYFLLITLIFSYLLGFLVFGFGSNFTIKGINLNVVEGIGFTLGLYLFTSLPLLAFSMIITFFSVTFNNEGLVIGIGITLLFILGLISNISTSLAPFLINNYFNLYSFFTSDIGLSDLFFAFTVILLYGIIFLVVSIFIFDKKEVLL